VPQFTDPSRRPIAQQILVLGTILVALACPSDGSHALLAARGSRTA